MAVQRRLAAILAAFATGVPNFKLDASTDALLLESDPDLRAFREMSMRYKTREFMFIAVVTEDDLLADSTIALVRDLRDEIISETTAREVYGVVAAEGGKAVDEAATAALRERLGTG